MTHRQLLIQVRIAAIHHTQRVKYAFNTHSVLTEHLSQRALTSARLPLDAQSAYVEAHRTFHCNTGHSGHATNIPLIHGGGGHRTPLSLAYTAVTFLPRSAATEKAHAPLGQRSPKLTCGLRALLTSNTHATRMCVTQPGHRHGAGVVPVSTCELPACIELALLQ